MHILCHIDTVLYSDNKTWCDLQNIALLVCVIGINRVIAIRAMQSAAGNINKQPLTCNLYFSFQNSWYTRLTLYIQYEHTVYSHMFTWTLVFFRNLFMYLCLLLLAENIYLVMFSKYKFCPKPFEAYQNLLIFSEFTYFFLVLMHVFQKDLLYCSDIGFRNGNLKILFLKERVTSEDILTHDTALYARKKFGVANKFIMRMLEGEGNGR